MLNVRFWLLRDEFLGSGSLFTHLPEFLLGFLCVIWIAVWVPFPTQSIPLNGFTSHVHTRIAGASLSEASDVRDDAARSLQNMVAHSALSAPNTLLQGSRIMPANY